MDDQMKKLTATVLTLMTLFSAAALMASSDAPLSPSQETQRAEYEAMLKEAEKARAEAETARQEATKAAQRARELMREQVQDDVGRQAADHAREQAEMERAREELSRAHRELREASREVARAHRDLSRSGKTTEIIRRINLGDRAVIGVVLGKQTDRGIQIIGVSPDGPAEQAGLQQGDVLVSIKGIDLANADEARQTVFDVMGGVEDGEQLDVVVDRNGSTGEYTITAEQREPRGWQSVIRIPEVAAVPEDSEAPRVIVEHIEIEDFDEEALAKHVNRLTEMVEQKKFIFMSEDGADLQEFEFEEFSDFGGHALSEANVWFGLPHAHGLELAAINEGLGAYFKTDRGVLVIRAREGNAYELESGDVILSIGTAKVNSPSDMMRALRDVEPGSEIKIDIMRDRKDKTLKVVVPENRLGYR